MNKIVINNQRDLKTEKIQYETCQKKLRIER